MPSSQRGFAPILIIVALSIVGAIVFGVIINQFTSLANKTQSGVKEDKKLDRLTEKDLEELHQINDKLKQYSDSRMIFTSGNPSTDPKWWGHWNITESDLKNKNINLNPIYPNQVINGLKNFSIILNGYNSIDLNKNRVFLGISAKFIKIFEDLIIKANISISAGQGWLNLPKQEKSAYLLANPASGANVLKDSSYLDAFKIVKAYILKQNEQNINEIMSICNSAKLEKVKYECYFQASVDYIDDFDCNLLPEGREEYKQICFAWKGIYNQDKGYCKLAGLRSSWCESQIHNTD